LIILPKQEKSCLRIFDLRGFSAQSNILLPESQKNLKLTMPCLYRLACMIFVVLFYIKKKDFKDDRKNILYKNKIKTKQNKKIPAKAGIKT